MTNNHYSAIRDLGFWTWFLGVLCIIGISGLLEFAWWAGVSLTCIWTLAHFSWWEG